MKSLDLPYAKSVLIELLRKDGVPITTLQKIVTSYNTVKKLIDSFEKDGFAEKKELMIGRKTFQVRLTPKGRAVAVALGIAEAIAKGDIEEEYRLKREQEKYSNPVVMDDIPLTFNRDTWNARMKRMREMYHVNVYEDHITVTERNMDGLEKDRIINIYLKVNGKGVLRLWCEYDEDFVCPHVDYAWTLPEIQEMVQGQKEKGNLKE